MREIPTYKNMSELLEVLKRMKAEAPPFQIEFFPIQPVCIGGKIGFVDWENYELECLPLFDDYDRAFTSMFDCICVRQGDKWGVLNGCFRYELPVEYSYSVANQVCRVMNRQQLESQSIRKYGAMMQLS